MKYTYYSIFSALFALAGILSVGISPTLAASAPAVSTQPATSIGQTDARLNGIFNANGASTTVYFKYGLSSNSLNTTTALQSVGLGSGTFSESISGLSSNTTYYFRAFATNSVGTTQATSVLSFTTQQGQIISAPTVSTASAQSVGINDATLRANYNANGASTTIYFKYGTSSNNLNQTTQITSVGLGSGTFSYAIGGLNAGTTYYFRAFATNSVGTTQATSVLSFNTAQDPNTTSAPTVSTQSATSVAQTSATLNANYNANGATTTVYFKYGIASNSLTQTTALQNVGLGSGNHSYGISGLTSGTTYYFRAFATNSVGTTQATSVLSFTTTNTQVSSSPTVSTQSATGISQTGATLNANYNANGASTTVYFKYGLSSNSLSTATALQTLGLGSGSATQSISNLTPNTIYYFRAFATNSVGTTQATSILSFTTLNTTQTIFECNDGADNDGDGFTDLNDPSCSSTTDNTEAPFDTINTSTQCNDNIDNDNDGDIDYGNDPGCTSLTDNTESPNPSTNNNANPSVTTNSADNVDEDSASLEGEVDVDGGEVDRWFEWGEDDSDLDETLTVSGTQDNDGDFSRTLNGLDEDTTYYYRACAEDINSGNDDCGSIKEFTTDEDNSSSNNNNNDDDNDFVVTTSSLTALTTIATGVNRTSATLNGLVVNGTGSPVSAWFEYGPTPSFGLTSPLSSLGTMSNAPLSTTIFGLNPNTTYYFRTVAVTSNGTVARGTIGSFITVVSGSTTVVTTITTGNGSTSNMMLDITPDTDSIGAGERTNYDISYKNISGAEMRNVVIRVTLPKDFTFRRATKGSFDNGDNTLTVLLGDLSRNEDGEFSLEAISGKSFDTDTVVTTATLAYTKPSGAQEDVIDYAIQRVATNNTVGNSLTGLALFGGGGFFPTSLLGWLLLIVAILAIIVIVRGVAVKKAE
jgi:hypothetical protein